MTDHPADKERRTNDTAKRLRELADSIGEPGGTVLMSAAELRYVASVIEQLAVAENGGDIVDEVFIICDALGIERPEDDRDRGRYVFAWEEPTE